MYEELLIVAVEHLGFLDYNCEFTVTSRSKLLTEACRIRQNGFSLHKLKHFLLRLYTYVMFLKLLKCILMKLLVKILQ